MKIVNKQVLTDTQNTRITKLEVKTPLIASKARAGEFVVLMTGESGERIPLTIVEANEETGVISLIFQELGFSTKLLGKLNVGDSLYALVGPLGRRTKIQNYGKVILVGGGVGIAEIFPVAKALTEEGNEVMTIIGARTKKLLILEKELKNASSKLFVATDDGSYGSKGFTTDVLKEILARDKYSLVYAVGPIPMMKAVSSVTKVFNVKTIVSLNAIMVDATGMCGCCRVTVGGNLKFSCIDGPEFDGHLVDWDELAKRNSVYEEKEKHICKLLE